MSGQVPNEEDIARYNDALDVECPHGAQAGWNCHQCTGQIVAKIVVAAREEASREAARDVCDGCKEGLPLTEEFEHWLPCSCGEEGHGVREGVAGYTVSCGADSIHRRLSGESE